MFTAETNAIVAQEQHKDRIHNLDRRYMLAIAATNQPAWYCRGCTRLGRLLKMWGARLEQIGESTPSKAISAEV